MEEKWPGGQKADEKKMEAAGQRGREKLERKGDAPQVTKVSNEIRVGRTAAECFSATSPRTLATFAFSATVAAKNKNCTDQDVNVCWCI